MGNDFFKGIAINPIIAAVNHSNKLDRALCSPCENLFLLTGNITDIGKIIEKIKLKGKGVYIHVDLIEGLSKDIWGLKYIVNKTKPDGIITTKNNIAKFSRECNIFTIQRLFMLDSLSLDSGIRSIRESNPNAIEILPGIMPKIVKEISRRSNIPIITGGLISEKEDVIESLSSGAVAVSTSNEKVWYM